MQPCGFLVLDKPPGLSSRAAVDAVARWFPHGTRLGHTGTLDPLATGVLVVAVGAATRLCGRVQEMVKTYRAAIRLGARSTTDDAEGALTPAAPATIPERGDVERVLGTLVGDVVQTPPAFSAVKVGGRRAYLLARRGEEVKLAPRTVRIAGLDLLSYEYPDLEVEVVCGKGTYLRSLARDLGEHLGCGGYLTALRRRRVGPFTETIALSLDTAPAAGQAALLDLAWSVADLPRVTVPKPEARRFARGQFLPVSARLSAGPVGVFDDDGTFVGVGAVDNTWLRPRRVFYRATVDDEPWDSARAPASSL
ncbi:MAG: tRNA pseudouridine(55) synthase TruB [Gemmataceae bacterium]|nr:tRNA pseudouridine(55) synthase TruB [Gemmataceae bacterium]